MATVLRAKLSENHKYYIDKHRHYELKHFCLQYPSWKKAYSDLDGYGETNNEAVGSDKIATDPTSKIVDLRISYLDKMKIIEQTAIAADPDLYSYILKGVTEGLSYPQLKTKYGIPCGRDMYYDRYRKFFWLLHKVRG